MKKISVLVSALVLVGLGLVLESGCKPKKTVSVPSGKITSAEPNSFTEVTSKLDTGGNFYLYLSTEQWLNNLSGKVGSWHEMVTAIPDLQDKREQIDNAFKIGGQLIKDSGLESISGIGMSSIAREPGFYYNKLVIHHYSGQGNGFIWTICGKEPHALSGLDLLPTNTAMATFYDLDAAQVWSVIQKECEQFPQAKEFLKMFPQQFEKGTGIKWDDAVNSLDGEMGMVITLDDSKMVKIPMPSQQILEIPEPAIMLVVKVKNDVIFNKFDEAVRKTHQRGMVISDKDGLKIRTVPVPLPLPITLRPTVATSGGYLFLSTSDATVLEALAVKGGKAGLKSTDEFKKLSADIPQQGNQFCFLSQRFGQTVMKIQQQTLAANNQMPAQLKELVQPFMDPNKAAYTFAVGANTDEGWITVANGNQGSGNLLAASAAVPAIAAAVALPAMAKGKETAQKNVCLNNLRMIEAAKNQWALEKSKASTDVPTWDDLQPYMNKPKLQCPKGGDYTIGPVGESPKCTIPGHSLP